MEQAEYFQKMEKFMMANLRIACLMEMEYLFIITYKVLKKDYIKIIKRKNLNIKFNLIALMIFIKL